jgi:hypothetical protein
MAAFLAVSPPAAQAADPQSSVSATPKTNPVALVAMMFSFVVPLQVCG